MKGSRSTVWPVRRPSATHRTHNPSRVPPASTAPVSPPRIATLFQTSALLPSHAAGFKSSKPPSGSNRGWRLRPFLRRRVRIRMGCRGRLLRLHPRFVSHAEGFPWESQGTGTATDRRGGLTPRCQSPPKSQTARNEIWSTSKLRPVHKQGQGNGKGRLHFIAKSDSI